MDRELELKFLIAPEAGPRILEALDGEGAVHQLDATYYDTPDHALRRAGFGLRVRDGEGGRKQTLKSASAGGVFSRGEWEGAIAGPEPDLDALARTPVAELLAGAALTPVFTTRVERTVRLVRLDDTVIEAALDRGDLLAGDRRAAVCELELELKSGRPEALFDLARTLAQRAPLRLSLISKAERGYGLAADARGGAPRWSSPILPATISVGEALQTLGQAALAHLCAALETLREAPGPDGVHQARIATRRLRVLLKIFKPLACDPAARRLKADLQGLAHELDAARELDVLVGEVWRKAAQGATFEGREAFERSLAAARATAYLRMEAALEGDRAQRTPLEAAAWLEAGAWTTDPTLASAREQKAVDHAAKVLARLMHRVSKAAQSFETLNVAGRHQLRLRVKALRYAAEDLASLFPAHPARVGRYIAASKALQDTLGVLNDRASQGRLIETAAQGDSAIARDALRVAALADDRDLVANAQRALHDLIAAKPFW